MTPLTILTVLRSGREYTPSWVQKLMNACNRHLTVPYRFACLSDEPVPCDRIPLEHDWPAWWAKIEIFRHGVITGPTLYMDLDSVILGNIDSLADLPYDFAMLRNMNMGNYASSAVMWLKNPPHLLYEIFSTAPDYYMSEFSKANAGMAANLGDQAYIFESLGRKVPFLSDDVPGLIRSYRHCSEGVPERCRIVCFGGPNKPHIARDDWVREAWR